MFGILICSQGNRFRVSKGNFSVIVFIYGMITYVKNFWFFALGTSAYFLGNLCMENCPAIHDVQTKLFFFRFQEILHYRIDWPAFHATMHMRDRRKSTPAFRRAECMCAVLWRLFAHHQKWHPGTSPCDETKFHRRLRRRLTGLPSTLATQHRMSGAISTNMMVVVGVWMWRCDQ